MWCGYTCPQTVWTDLMIAVERFFQGDRNAAHAPRQGALVVRDAVAEGRHASDLAADRRGDRRRLGVLFRRRADACAPARHLRRADASPISSSASSPPPPMCWAASPASRSASICAPGRASRAAWSIAIRCSITYRGLARRAARRRIRRGSPGRAGATASIAGNAWRSARPASTSATARSSNASNARSASMPATRSWTRSAGRAG